MDQPIPTVQKARLRSLVSNDPSIVVHFNPASLVYTLENIAPDDTMSARLDPSQRAGCSSRRMGIPPERTKRRATRSS